MPQLTAVVILSLANMSYAAIIYLSLHGWLVVHEPSGMQLLMHIIITAPAVMITSLLLFYLCKKKNFNTLFWKVNLVGLTVPIMSIQTGITYYHFDKMGLAVSIIVGLTLSVLLLLEFKKYNYR